MFAGGSLNVLLEKQLRDAEIAAKVAAELEEQRCAELQLQRQRQLHAEAAQRAAERAQSVVNAADLAADVLHISTTWDRVLRKLNITAEVAHYALTSDLKKQFKQVLAATSKYLITRSDAEAVGVHILSRYQKLTQSLFRCGH